MKVMAEISQKLHEIAAFTLRAQEQFIKAFFTPFLRRPLDLY